MAPAQAPAPLRLGCPMWVQIKCGGGQQDFAAGFHAFALTLLMTIQAMRAQSYESSHLRACPVVLIKHVVQLGLFVVVNTIGLQSRWRRHSL